MMRKNRLVIKALSKVLSESELALVPRSFDIIGDIAVIKLPDSLLHKKHLIGEALVEAVPNVKVALLQTSPVTGDLRLRRLEWLAGEKRTHTIHREYGCLYEVDLAKAYFSPRLQYERRRIAGLVRPGEVVVNMFSGVGCFSIMIAKHSRAERIYSIDINPDAYEYMKRNVKLNKVEDRVVPILGDAEKVIDNLLSGVADRVLMPLPEKNLEYLPSALKALKRGGGTIHYQAFVRVGSRLNPLDAAKSGLEDRLEELGARYSLEFGRVIRSVGPRRYQVALDVSIRL